MSFHFRLYRTESGLEVHFATNYLGFFLLSNLLLSLISTSGENGIRVKNVTGDFMKKLPVCTKDR